MLPLILLLCLLPIGEAQEKPAPKVERFMPTSAVVRVAAMAARDEGYDPDSQGTYLDELRKNGKEPIHGYASIGLYNDGHLVRYYSIRIDTGDVVDPMACKIFRFPDLINYKKKTMKAWGTKEASIERIEDEIGCDTLKIVTSKPKREAK